MRQPLVEEAVDNNTTTAGAGWATTATTTAGAAAAGSAAVAAAAQGNRAEERRTPLLGEVRGKIVPIVSKGWEEFGTGIANTPAIVPGPEERSLNTEMEIEPEVNGHVVSLWGAYCNRSCRKKCLSRTFLEVWQSAPVSDGFRVNNLADQSINNQQMLAPLHRAIEMNRWAFYYMFATLAAAQNRQGSGIGVVLLDYPTYLCLGKDADGQAAGYLGRLDNQDCSLVLELVNANLAGNAIKNSACGYQLTLVEESTRDKRKITGIYAFGKTWLPQGGSAGSACFVLAIILTAFAFFFCLYGFFVFSAGRVKRFNATDGLEYTEEDYVAMGLG